MNWKKISAVFVGAASFLYLLNPGFGVFELLPDNIPGVGNLDEGTAGILLLWAIQTLIAKKILPPPYEKSANP
ncbi:MAG: hypothetical protein SH807_08520 [Blastochloris sp.]|jgi:hypothetical protein|nr:hypothetical protein [Blastochloris sp.]